MRCKCKECEGSGRVEVDCGECDGEGKVRGSIFDIELFEGTVHEDELDKLVCDAYKVQEQTEELVKLNPSKEHRYREQLAETIAKIEKQA